jgi:hypothetical protein
LNGHRFYEVFRRARGRTARRLVAATTTAATIGALAMVATAPAAHAAGATISGTVTTGGNPLGGICVSAWTPGEDPVLIPGTKVTTGADGTYTMSGIPAGNVQVRFDGDGQCPGATTTNYVMQWWDDKKVSDLADVITVADGDAVTNINAAMVLGGAISGKITAKGAGIGGICVAAKDNDLDEATRAAIGTFADGTYTLNGVPTGAVKVVINEHVAGRMCANNGLADLTIPEASYDTVTVNVDATTTQVDAALGFPINANPNTIHAGDSAALGATGVPAHGTVKFSASGQPNLCTITLPAASCNTAGSLPVGSYTVSATYTPTHAGYHGSGSTNSPSLTVSPALVAPGAPTNVHATKTASGVKVTWTAPVSDGGTAITGYTVTTSPGGKSVSVNGSTLTATIAGLTPGTYTFKVRAANSVGNGAFSSPSNAVTIVAAQNARVGYWMLGSDGHVYGFGDAKNLGSASGGAAAITSRLDGKGYWVVDGKGNVKAFGTAANFGGKPSLLAGERVSAISATPSGNGYWLFTNLGRAFAFGGAKFFGDMRGTHLNGGVIASAATATGKGYYMVGSDGGVFSFGDAKFHGSTGNMKLNKPVVGISPTPDNQGYWLVASDGGVFAFHAPFRGSMGAKHLNQPVNGLVAFGNGYLMVASDGGVFDFSNKPFLGSLGGHPPAAPIIGITAFATT